MNCTPEELRHIFESYRSVLLTAHVSPDGDALGSLAAMAAWLKGRGKDVLVVIDDTIDDTFRRFEGCKDIVRPEDVQADPERLSVVLDATDPGRTGKVAALMTGKVVNIDHHVSNTHFADWEYIRTDCAATGEILTELFTGWGAEITPSMADALYMAIATDCGFFKFGNTTGHTLRMAALLVETGAAPNRVSERLEETTLVKINALVKVLQRIELFAGGRVAGISFTEEVQRYTGEHTGGYIDYARRIRGVDVAFTVKYISPDETRVSLRSRNVDVNAVAAVFGGGGHVRAAGCTIVKPLEEAKAALVAVIGKAL